MLRVKPHPQVWCFYMLFVFFFCIFVFLFFDGAISDCRNQNILLNCLQRKSGFSFLQSKVQTADDDLHRISQHRREKAFNSSRTETRGRL